MFFEKFPQKKKHKSDKHIGTKLEPILVKIVSKGYIDDNSR